MSRRTYSWNAYESELASPLTAGSLAIDLASAIGLREPGYLVIAPDDPSKREYFKFANINGNTLENVTRGLAGSAAGAQDHVTGSKVRAVAVHQWLDDIFSDVEDLEAWDLAHVTTDPDPHTIYLREVEADGLYLRLDGTTVPTANISMGGFKIINLLDPTAGQDAANLQWVNQRLAADLANYLPLSGGTMTGAIDMGTSKITSLGAPTADDDASTKKYVDDTVALYLPLTGGVITGNLTVNGDFTISNPSAVVAIQAETSISNKLIIKTGLIEIVGDGSVISFLGPAASNDMTISNTGGRLSFVSSGLDGEMFRIGVANVSVIGATMDLRPIGADNAGAGLQPNKLGEANNRWAEVHAGKYLNPDQGTLIGDADSDELVTRAWVEANFAAIGHTHP